MHTRLFALDDAANAMCYGFYEETRNGHRIIGHGGDTVFFHSDLHLVLDQKVGFYVSYNSAGTSLPVWEILPARQFLGGFPRCYYPYVLPIERLPVGKMLPGGLWNLHLESA